MTDKMPVAIIGGGALGLAIANRLLRQGCSGVALLEKNDAFGIEQSGSNSGVIHAGFLYKPGTLMAELCVDGSEILYDFCARNRVPCERTGKLMVAANPQQKRNLEVYFKQAKDNGLQDVAVFTAKEVKKLEPCVDAQAALYIPQSGIFDASAFIAALYRKTAAAHDTPDLLMKGCRVVGVQPKEGFFTVTVEQLRGATKRWQLDCEILINAAGLYSLDIAKMMNPDLPYEKQYLRGEYYQFNRRSDLFIHMNVYPTPVMVELPGGGKFLDLGAHLTPKVGPDEKGAARIAKEVLVGPIFSEVTDPEDHRSTMDSGQFYSSVKPFFPSLCKDDLYRGHTGILGLIKDQTDFIIYRDERYPNCIHLLGMESPALTAAFAIAKYVANLIT